MEHSEEDQGRIGGVKQTYDYAETRNAAVLAAMMVSSVMVTHPVSKSGWQSFVTGSTK